MVHSPEGASATKSVRVLRFSVRLLKCSRSWTTFLPHGIGFSLIEERRGQQLDTRAAGSRKVCAVTFARGSSERPMRPWIRVPRRPIPAERATALHGPCRS
jgi:hypothetical protein